MKGATTETEVKLRIDSPDALARRLEALGARRTRPREFEDNILLDRADDSLKAAGKMLRLRRVGDRCVLTYKAPLAGAGERHKVREEHESRIDDFDALVRILEGLGYRTAYRYQKYRSVYALDQLEACIDETPIGCFLELEGAPAAIDRTAALLGFSEENYIRCTYRDLHLESAGGSERDLGDLVFADRIQARG